MANGLEGSLSTKRQVKRDVHVTFMKKRRRRQQLQMKEVLTQIDCLVKQDGNHF